MLQNSMDVFFLRVLKRRRQRNTDAPCLETPKPTERLENRPKVDQKTIKPIGYVLHNFRDVFFLEVLGAAGSATHTHTPCWETLKPAKR